MGAVADLFFSQNLGVKNLLWSGVGGVGERGGVWGVGERGGVVWVRFYLEKGIICSKIYIS